MGLQIAGVTVVDDDRQGTFAYANIISSISSVGVLPSPPSYGTVAGYTSGGEMTPPITKTIDKFPFATNTNATNVGDLTWGARIGAGQSSQFNGYASGRDTGYSIPSHLIIEKFSFSSNGNGSIYGDLTAVNRLYASGQSSERNGYTSGGFVATPGFHTNVIDKFLFTYESNATDVGDLTVARGNLGGISSSVNGYCAGGAIPAPTNYSAVIDKFPFSTDSNATSPGTLPESRSYLTGLSSLDAGYVAGGFISTGGVFTSYSKFPFASETTFTTVANGLTFARYSLTSQTSTTHGYTSGGILPPNHSNIIDRFQFSNDSDSSDVGDLVVARSVAGGHQD